MKKFTYAYRVSGAVAVAMFLVLAKVSQGGSLKLPLFLIVTAAASLAVLTALYSKLRLLRVPMARIYGLLVFLVISFSVAAGSIAFKR